jgi:hypothetical protein
MTTFEEKYADLTPNKDDNWVESYNRGFLQGFRAGKQSEFGASRIEKILKKYKHFWQKIFPN